MAISAQQPPKMAVTGLRTMMFSSTPAGFTKVRYLQHVQVLSIQPSTKLYYLLGTALTKCPRVFCSKEILSSSLISALFTSSCLQPSFTTHLKIDATNLACSRAAKPCQCQNLGKPGWKMLLKSKAERTQLQFLLGQFRLLLLSLLPSFGSCTHLAPPGLFLQLCSSSDQGWNNQAPAWHKPSCLGQQTSILPVLQASFELVPVT